MTAWRVSAIPCCKHPSADTLYSYTMEFISKLLYGNNPQTNNKIIFPFLLGGGHIWDIFLHKTFCGKLSYIHRNVCLYNSNMEDLIFFLILLADVGFPCVPSCRWYAFGSSWQEGFQWVLDVWRVGVLSFFQKKPLLLKLVLQLHKGVLGFWVVIALWAFWKINKNWVWVSKQLEFRKFCCQVEFLWGENLSFDSGFLFPQAVTINYFWKLRNCTETIHSLFSKCCLWYS